MKTDYPIFIMKYNSMYQIISKIDFSCLSSTSSPERLYDLLCKWYIDTAGSVSTYEYWSGRLSECTYPQQPPESILNIRRTALESGECDVYNVSIERAFEKAKTALRNKVKESSKESAPASKLKLFKSKLKTCNAQQKESTPAETQVSHKRIKPAGAGAKKKFIKKS